MKYGAHVFLWTEKWTESYPDLFRRAASLGMDFVELSCGDDVIFDAAAVGAEARALGLEVTLSPGGRWPMDADISLPEPKSQRHGLDWHRRYLDQAADLGATAYSGALYSHPGHVEPRLPGAADYARVAEHLATLAEYAAGRGVRFVVEPMSHFRTFLVNRPEQVVTLLEMAQHPNLGILLDTYHLVTEVRDYAQAVHTAAPYLWGIHACESDRGVPGGGLVPWAEMFQALNAIGFDGHVAMESYTSGPEQMAPRRGLYGDICPDGDAFVRQGLAFIRHIHESARPGAW
jgi:D-psicose/D-tagatose/L-ribulose 3-epimerase